jgi:hypothetical protein
MIPSVQRFYNWTHCICTVTMVGDVTMENKLHSLLLSKTDLKALLASSIKDVFKVNRNN